MAEELHEWLQRKLSRLPPFDELASDRKLAASNGDVYYFTGNACTNGHVSVRRTTSRTCMACFWSWRFLARPRIYSKYRAHLAKEYSDMPWRRLLRFSKKRALEKGLPNDLTAAWARANWTGRCALTGIEFKIINSVARKGEWRGSASFGPSIDRIDPKVGYIQSNCRFVLRCINVFRAHDMTDEDMLTIAKALLAHADG